MSAHGVAADSLPTIYRKVCLNECGQFLSNVVVHLVVLIPGSLCGVDVKTGPGAEVIAVILARQVHAPRAGIGADDRYTQLGSNPLCPRFLHEVFIST